MSQCLWCNEVVTHAVTFAEILYKNKPVASLCDRCRSQLEVLKGDSNCRGCGRSCPVEYCGDCRMWKKLYPDYTFHHTALFKYNSFAKEYMERYKIQGDCECAAVFSNDIKVTLTRKQRTMLIVPIPVSSNSNETRGFNQTTLLLEHSGISHVCLLNHIGTEEKQSKKNKDQRMGSRQPFEVIEERKKQIKGASILLVDDIYTTGRTLFHAADAVREYCPEKIETFSLFR